jgi:polysaccharide pyruvyl transferase WcaK-like protein
MRVGVITFHHTTNYGATLQCYALRQAIERLGHECSVIDYRHPSAVAFYRRKDLFNRNAVRTFPKRLRFQRFMKDELNMTPRTTLADLPNLAHDFDAIVAGSDQVFSIGSPRGWSREYYLSFVPDEVRKVAYAPSFGMTRLESLGHRRDELATLLRRFDAISGRDSNSSEIISTLTGSAVPTVLDPTFLADFSDVEQRSGSSWSKTPYLLSYGLPADAKLGQRVRRFAHAQGWKFISLASGSPSADFTLNSEGPASFLGLIRDASMVITPFFHGTIFSILYNKPFVSLSSPSKAIKITDLLRRLGLSERQVRPEQVDERVLSSMNSIKAGELASTLAPLRAASNQFLESSLN